VSKSAAIKFDIALQPKQLAVYELVENSPATEIGYGGARGGAKSHVARGIMLLRRLKYARTNGLFLMRVWGQIYRNHLEPLFREFPFMANWYVGGDKRHLTLPSGSRIYFASADTRDGIRKIAQGPEYADIFVEEATHFSEEELIFLPTALRWTGKSGITPKMLYTCNPGSRGHDYIKRIFKDRRFEEHEEPDSFAFVQAYGWDNIEWVRPYLHEQNITDFEYYNTWTDQQRFQCFIANSDYGAKLNQMPEKERKAHLFGDWDTFEGQYYPNFIRAQRELKAAQVGQLMQPWWRRWASCDWGYQHAASIHWHASGLVSPEDARRHLGREWSEAREVVITYREHVVAGRPEMLLAQDFVERCDNDDRRELSRFFMSPETFGERNAVADIFRKVFREHSLPQPEEARNDRVNGWRFIHTLIEQDRWFVSDRCEGALTAIPSLIYDDKKLEDVMKTSKVSDDIADEVRYGLFSMLGPSAKPYEVRLRETLAPIQDMTAKHLAHLDFKRKNRKRSAGFTVGR
jgi:phage terminase large subunit